MRLTFLILTLALCTSIFAQTDTTRDTTNYPALLEQQALALMPFATTELAQRFLAAAESLPHIEPRVIYVKRATREYLSESAHTALPDSARAGFERRELGDQFYYFTRYGTPLAYVRAFDLVGQAGMKTWTGAKIADFGFGTIGHLRLLAANGAHVTGIEVDPLLKLVYSHPSDTGEIPAFSPDETNPGTPGHLSLVFGQFPADKTTTAAVPSGLDLFVSKNTLKRGYIHPEHEVDPRMLVQLGVDDTTFVRTVYSMLKPGGYFMIYNLHPKRLTPEELAAPDAKYLPWSDGRCPFTRELLESVGFTVIAYDIDDTAPARAMGDILGWKEQMNYATDLYGTYTLLRK